MNVIWLELYNVVCTQPQLSTTELSLLKHCPQHPHAQNQFCSGKSCANPITAAADRSSFPLLYFHYL